MTQTRGDLVLVLEDQAETRAWLANVASAVFPGVTVIEAANLAQASAWLDSGDEALARLRSASSCSRRDRAVALCSSTGGGTGFRCSHMRRLRN